MGLTILAGGEGVAASVISSATASVEQPVPVAASVPVASTGGQEPVGQSGTPMADHDAAMVEHEARMETERVEQEARMVEEQAAQEVRMKEEVVRHDAEMEAYLKSQGLQAPQ